jgi:hypothetical protein
MGTALWPAMMKLRGAKMARFGTTGSKGRICVCHLHKRDVPRRPNGVTVRRRLSSTTPTRKQPGHTAVLANGECAKWRAKISNEGHKAHLFRRPDLARCSPKLALGVSNTHVSRTQRCSLNQQCKPRTKGAEQQIATEIMLQPRAPLIGLLESLEGVTLTTS